MGSGRGLRDGGRGLLTGGGSSIPPPSHSAPNSRGGPRMLRGHDGPAAWRVWNLHHLWGRLRDFYQEELQLLILLPPPDLQTLGFDPLSGALPTHPFLPLSPYYPPHPAQLTPWGMCTAEEAMEQLEGVLRLLLGASVQCEHRELFIRHIQGLSLEVQSELAAAIQEVTQPGAGVVLALSGPEPGELAPAELEMLSRSLIGMLSRLARERDLGAQRLAELLLEREPLCLRPEVPSRAPAEGPSHHLALELANAKAQLRRLRQELEEKAELLLDSQAEVQGLEAEIRRLRQEVQALSGQAKRAELYREEVEALRERAGRLPRLQEELRRCRERLQAAEACKGQLEGCMAHRFSLVYHQEERVLSGVLEASKALLEEQLEAARERCARLHETQRENLLLRTRLGEAHAELDSLRHQVDHLAEENVELELELQRSLQPPPGSPGEAPLPEAVPSLQDEVREAEAGQLRMLERENRELRGLLQVLQGQPGGQVSPLPQRPGRLLPCKGPGPSLGLTVPLLCPQHPLLEAPSEDPMLPGLEEAPQTPVAFDHSPQGLVQKARDGGPQTLSLALLASDSVLKRSAECPQAPDSDPQEAERPLQAAALDPHTSDWFPQQSDSAVETQASLEKAGRSSSLQSPASVAPPQGPGTKIQAQQLLGGGTEGREAPQGESVPEAQELRQEGAEHKPGPLQPSPVKLEEQEGPCQDLDLATGQTEARGQDQRLEGMVGDPAQQKPQWKSEEALEVQAWEGPIPGESLASGVAEQEALREEVTQLRRKAEALGVELEAQARKLEAQGMEAARLSKELAQARKAEAEAHREAEAQAWEQARLREAVEAARRELEAASREREALAEALAAVGRERRQWEREGSRLRTQSEAAEERMQALEREGRQHLQEAERERQEKEALQGLLIPSAAARCVHGTKLGLEIERQSPPLPSKGVPGLGHRATSTA
ncbi:Coiled-coil domain-containing protein 88B [Saguinus oedipus]|uniref:Coiled-coil domain-containing protein 88B n=1 Tax=Saguinus oedipus TaxID=9490 RepID=A0ABQ9UUT3_SAGOE|nr:Coiled-coil domain-containing protein 88B [Saguinus oedipus]